MILWNRLRYVLSPQFDVYRVIAQAVKGRVADVGFGTGVGTHLLTQKAEEVCGFEIDNEAIGFARVMFPFRGISFTYGNIIEGITGMLFDYVVMIDVIEHIENDQEALENVKKMMDEGGFFICSTPNRASRYRKATTHIREYNLQEFKVLLDKAFKKVDIRNYNLSKRASEHDNPMVAVCHK